MDTPTEMPDPPPDDSTDGALAEAFGRDRGRTIPLPSVLRILQERSRTRLGVHLDAPDSDDPPVLVTDEARELRDPAGRYQLLGEIGRGGIGRVFKGRDQDLGRDVAMKVLRDEFADRPDVLARFVEEAQIGGQLQHPGIVPVYELGLHAGERPYFAMKLVKGETLAARLAGRRRPTDDRRLLLGIFEQICQTIAYAHARNVIHRDLKPANVMIGSFGEVQVVDWGLAKVLKKGGVADESLANAAGRSAIETVRTRSGTDSRAGSMLGTPTYMAPEQAMGDIGRVHKTSDVFALGGILCEILTGEPPYREQDGDLARQAANGLLDGALSRLAACGADRELVALCTECLAPARMARPASAGEVAERVSRYLTSVEERARKAEVRATKMRLSAAAAVLLVVLGAGSWAWLEQREQQHRDDLAQRFTAAMSAANRAFGEARVRTNGHMVEVARWDAADAMAANLASLLDSEAVAADVKDEARELLGQIAAASREARVVAERRQRDAEMVERLRTLRVPIDDEITKPGWRASERARLAGGYEAAFAAFLGRDSMFELTPEAAVAELRESGERVELATSLDLWALVRDELAHNGVEQDAERTARIRRIAATLDDDDWRSRLRELLPDAANRRGALEELASTADLGALTAAGCRVLASALGRAGAALVATDVLLRAREAHPRDFDLCFTLAIARELADGPQWEEVVHTLDLAHVLEPDHAEVLHRKGLALMKLRRHADAERCYRRLVALRERDKHFRQHLGDAVASQGRYVEAIAIYREALAIDDDPKERSSGGHGRDGVLLNNIGNTLERLGRIDEAIECYRQALAVADEDPAVMSNLGRLLFDKGDTREGLELLRKAVAKAPGDPRFCGNLGNALMRMGRPGDAMAVMQDAIDQSPEDPRGYMWLGTVLMSSEIDRSLELLSRAVELDPDHAEARWHLAAALRRSGRPGKALEQFRQAVALAPQVGRFHCSLGQILFLDFHEPDEACEQFRLTVKLDPNLAAESQVHNLLGSALAARGDREEAIASFREGVALDETDAPCHLNLGMLLRLQGSPESLAEARQHLARAIELFAARQVSSPQWAATAKLELKLSELYEVVEEVLGGERQPRDAYELAAAIDRGSAQGRLREVVELTVRTSDSQPELVTEMPRIRYNAARAAARLATDDTVSVADEVRVDARRRAYGWLTAVVDARLEQSRLGADSGQRLGSLGMLRQPLIDRDFDGIRGEALASLPPEEREAWRQLWERLESAIDEELRRLDEVR